MTRKHERKGAAADKASRIDHISADFEYKASLDVALAEPIKLAVPQDRMGLVIGKRGCNIRSIASGSGAKSIAGAEFASRSTILLSGTPKQVDKAKGAVAQAAGPIGRQEAETRCPVPEMMVKHIIGKGGQCIKSMSTISGAFIRLQVDESGGNYVVMSGSQAQVDKAVALVQEVLKYPKLTGQLTEDCVEVVMPIKPDSVGVIIGKGGCNINSIRKLSDAWLRVEGADVAKPAVVIRGTPSQVNTAQVLVVATLERRDRKQSSKLSKDERMALRAGEKGARARKILKDREKSREAAEH